MHGRPVASYDPVWIHCTQLIFPLIYIDIPGKLLHNFSSTLAGVRGQTGKRENGTSVRGQQRRTGDTADNSPIKKHVNGRELSTQVRVDS